jgi:hypothetical protein
MDAWLAVGALTDRSTARGWTIAGSDDALARMWGRGHGVDYPGWWMDVVFSRSPTSYRLGAAVSPIRIQGTITVRPKSNADQESRELGRTPERRQSPGKKMMLLRGVDLDFRVPGADDQNSNSAHVARTRPQYIPSGRSIVGAVEEHESVRVFDNVCARACSFQPTSTLPPSRSSNLPDRKYCVQGLRP